jgi:hypothetical protein
MATTDTTPGIPADLEADALAVIAKMTTGKPVDPETSRRIRERAERISKEIREKHGTVDIAVPAVRELRGELPDA